MKSSIFLVCLSLLAAGNAVTLVMGAPAGPGGKSTAPTLSKEQSAKLTELKRQQAANEAEIQRLRTKVKHDADLRAAHARQGKSPPPADSLSESGSAAQLKLQQKMDRKKQLEEEISRIMKASSDTSESVIGNMK